MKKILLVLIVLLGTVPLFSQGLLKVTAGTTIKSNNGVYLVANNMNLVNDGIIQQSKSDGTVKFTGNSNISISGNGTTNLGRMNLAVAPGSALSLQSNIKVDSEFVFTTGLLNLGNFKLDLGSSGFLTNESASARAYTTGTGYIEAVRTLNNPSSVNAGNLGAVISSVSDLGSTTIRRGHKVQNNIYGSNNSIQRYYDIIPANNTSLNATLRFRYLQGELNGISEDTPGLWKSDDNISWTQAGYTTRDTINNYVEKTGISSFSRWTISKFINTAGFRNISINNPSSIEGDNGTKELKFVVRLNAASASVVQVQYTTLDSTATSGVDYVSNSGMLTFAPGQLTDTIRVLINGDAEAEPDEYVLVQLTNAVNAIITTGHARGTIRNDDSYPSIIITNYTVPEGNTSDTTLLVKVRLNQRYPLPVSVNYATQDSTATAGSDYVSSSGTLVFTPGDTLEYIPVTILADRIDEPNEIISINLSNAVNATLGATVRGRITIANDDPLPQVIFTNISIPEGSNEQFNNTSFTARLNRSYPLPITVRYTTQDSTAQAGTDYQLTNGIITFEPGDTLETINIPIMGDRVVESNEIIRLVFDSVTNATVSAAPFRITINNDDVLPQAIFTTTSVSEGNNDQYNNLEFTVRLNRTYPLPVTVNYQTQDSTATNGSDYQAANGVLTFIPGDTLETFTIPILGDRIVESNEIIKLVLSNATNATVSATSSRITITNDDNYPVININNITVTEGDAGNVNALFTVRISKRYPQDVSVQFTTQDVTAIAGLDYISTSGAVIFSADGDTLQTIIVPVSGDLLDEANETFKVQLSNAVNATIGGGGLATGTITDNDPVPSIRIYDTTTTEAYGNAILRVALNNPSGREVRVSYRTQEGNALDTLDYTRIILDTLIFQPGETEKIVNVTILTDAITEASETFSVILQSPVNGTVTASQGGDNTAIVTIIDSPPNLVMNKNSADLQSGHTAPVPEKKYVRKLEVTTTPNPFQGAVQFHIVSPETGELRILLYDANGLKVDELRQTVRESTLSIIPYEAKKKKQGILFYEITINKQRATGKLIQMD